MINRISKIGWETTVGELLEDERIKPFGQRIGLTVGIKKTMHFTDIVEQNPAWKHADMMYGFQRMYELLQANHSFCLDIYSKEERTKDKSKCRTGLFYFPTYKKDAPFVLIAPGGAYVSVACTVEGFPVAARLNEMGINAFVLSYRTGIGCLEMAKEDYCQALQYIHNQAKKLGISTKDYAVMGFSAGGHLTSLCATSMFNWEKLGISHPAAIILGYPLQNFKDGGAIIRMCKICAFGFFSSRKRRKKYYVPDKLTRYCPPVYIWQTLDDESVPFVANGNALYNALRSQGLAVQLRVVEHGPHGMGLAMESEADGWLEDAIHFWESMSYQPVGKI